MENPYTTILGHLTDAFSFSRDGYQIDMMNIIDGAARNRVILELNASLTGWILTGGISSMQRKRAVISINPDAYAVTGLGDAPLRG